MVNPGKVHLLSVLSSVKLTRVKSFLALGRELERTLDICSQDLACHVTPLHFLLSKLGTFRGTGEAVWSRVSSVRFAERVEYCVL